MAPFIVLIFAIVIAGLVWYKFTSTSTCPPLPPGPPGDPLIGHLRVIPQTGQDTFFYKLGKIYGDVMHFNVLGRSMIVLNSVEAAVELLDKRGANYSDRPSFPIYEIIGFSDSPAFMKYGKHLQQHRKIYQKYLGKFEATAYHYVQAREACVLVQNLMDKSDFREEHLVRYSAAIITHIAYGHRITSNSDVYFTLARDICDAAANSGPPGGTMVDLFPILRHFPSWFPGTYYANYARAQRTLVTNAYEYPMRDVKRQMANGTAKPSFLASQLQEIKNEEEEYDIIQRIQAAVTTLYTAGVETTSAYLSHFFLAMVLYPECQAAAQEEISKVVGSSRLPEFGDRSSLPYLECVLQETLRWNLATPLGVPHRSISDDIYNGMFIPKGSVVIANARAMTLDEETYADPFRFDPTRFLPKPQGRGEPHPTGHFGFGRRICPGRHVADDSLWIVIAIILATLNISKAVDEDGREVVPEVTFVTGIVSHPKPFPCSIRPRSDVVKSLVVNACLSDWD